MPMTADRIGVTAIGTATIGKSWTVRREEPGTRVRALSFGVEIIVLLARGDAVRIAGAPFGKSARGA
jgi:hypothetical protein